MKTARPSRLDFCLGIPGTWKWKSIGCHPIRTIIGRCLQYYQSLFTTMCCRLAVKKEQSNFSQDLQPLCLSKEVIIEQQSLLFEEANTIVKTLTEKSDADVTKCMMDRLKEVFCNVDRDRDTGRVLVKRVQISLAKFLAAHVTIRLQFDSVEVDHQIEQLLMLLLESKATDVDYGVCGGRTQALLKPQNRFVFFSLLPSDNAQALKDSLASDSWPGIKKSITWLRPKKCEELWSNFRPEVDEYLSTKLNSVISGVAWRTIVRVTDICAPSTSTR